MSRLRLLWVLLFSAISLLTLSQSPGDFQTSGLNTSWNNIASWERYDGSSWVAATAGQIPGTVGNAGNVTIRDAHTVNHDVAIALANAIASLTVGQGTSGTLTIGAFNFSVAGATTIAANGSVSLTSVTGTKTFTGDFTNNGTWNNSSNSTVTFAGSVTNNNTFTSGTGINTLSGTAKAINGTISFTSLTLNGTYTNNGTLAVVTTFAGAGTLTNAATGTINLSVATVTPTLTATSVGNTVNYIGGAQTVKATTYHHLSKASAGTATAGGAIIVNGNLSVTAGVLAMTTSALTVTGTTDIANLASLTGTTSTGTFTGDITNNGTWTKTTGTTGVAGNLTNNGTFTSGSGIYTFSGAAKTITTTNTAALNITNATFTNNYTISSNFGSGNLFSVTGATVLSVAASSITNNGFFSTPSLTLTNAASTFVNNGTVTITTTFAGSGTAVFTNAANSVLNNGAATTAPQIAASAVPNTVNYYRNVAQTIRGGSIIYYNLNVYGGAFTKTLGAAIEVLNAIDVSGSATLADGGFLITAGGSVSTTVGASSGYTTTRTATPWFTPIVSIDNSSTVTFASTAATALDNSIPSTYGNLTFAGSNTKTLPASFPITVNGNLTLSGTTIVADNGNTITVKGNIASTGTQSGAGKVLLTTGAAPHGVQGTGWNNVELDDTQGATLTAAFTIGTQNTGTFALTNGVVSMNTFNFTISNINAGGFTNGALSATTMVLQNGTGNFVRNISNTGLPITYLFPIGENTGVTEYSPVSYTVSANATISSLTFRVFDLQHPNDVNTTNFTSRYWSVVNAPNSFTYTASFSYPAADVTGTQSSFDVYRHDPTALTWQLNPATTGSGTATYDGTDGTFSAGEVFMVKAAVNIPSTVTIDGVGGSAGVYASLTGTTGFFNAVNQGIIASNVTVNVSAASITETGAIALFQTTETGAGAGTYTITIQSSDATQKVLTSTYSIATVGLQGTIRLNGADRVIFNGGTGTERKLLFRNTDTGVNGLVVHLFNDASNNQINNCVIEGSITSTTLGLIHIGTSTISGTGNDNNTITDNNFQQAGSNTPGIGLSSNGFSSTVTNDGTTISNNKFANIYRTSSTVAAIFINGNTGATTIDANRIYNDTPRSGAISTNLYGIYVNGTTNSNIDITNNVIGFANSSGTGVTSIISSGAVRFNPISVLASSTGTCEITGNIIDNITLTSTSGGASNFPLFAGVYAQTTGYLIDDNQIGALSGSPTIIITTTTATTLANAVCGISVNSTAASQTISNNRIGSISFALTSGTLSMNMNGIKAIAGTVNITGNHIGTASSNSFLLTVPGTSNAVNYGIYTTSTASNTVTIEDNVIRNLSAYGAGTGSQAVGIFSAGAALYSISGNEISHLRTTSTSVATVGSASVIGINLGTTGSAAHSIAQNTIHALTDSSAVNAVVNGIAVVSGTGICSIGRNTIYNLRSGTGTSSVVNGIHISTAQVAVHNNMIRLGYDAYGSTITNTSIITGILKDNSSTNNSYYYNSIYIGGSGVATTANNSFAFRRNVTGANDNVRNNIFVNARSNNTTGGKHYALYLTNTTTLTSDYNLLQATGAGGIVAFNGTTDQSTLQAWKANTTFDDNSISANPGFIAPTAATPNLKINTAASSPVESSAIAISGVTDDIDLLNIRIGYPLPAQTNGGGTAPDIGADESDLIALDVLPPVITVGPIAPINTACGTTQTITITAIATDVASGVAQGSLAPRLWWRLSSGTYASVSPTTVSGDTSTFDLVITGIAALQTYHYYVAAQDSAASPNIGYSHAGPTSPVHADVTATPSTINTAPGTFTILGTTPLSGSINVGSTEVYTSLNANATTGVFYSIMTNGLSGDLTVNVTSDLNENGLYYPLSAITEFCGSNYTVTIKPNTTTMRTISQSAGGNPLINLNGCTRVVIDGSSGGSGRYLTIAGRQNTATIYFNNNTNNVEIKNCVIEGNSQLTNSIGPGVINFAGLLGTGSSINNILIDNNIIRNRSDLAQTAANCPNVLINGGSVIGLFNGTSTPVKENITISNNEMHSFRQSAIAFSQNILGNGIGDSLSITGNKIYSPITQAQYQYVIYVEGGSNSKNHTISNNQIGGNALPAPDITGTWTNSLTDGEVWAIFMNSGGTEPGEETIIHNNKISNITLSGTGYANFLGIRVEYGRTEVTNNLIGSLSSSLTVPNIVNNGNGDLFDTSANSATMGIWTQSTEEVLIDSNIVCGLSSTGAYSFMDCIAHGSNLYLNGLSYSTPGGQAIITNNQIMYNRSGSGLQSLILSPEGFFGIFCWTDANDNLISKNKVYNCGSNTSTYNTNVRLHGIGVGVHGSTLAQTGIIDGNEISYIFNENPGDNTNATSRNPIIYGLDLANGDWTVSNNTIYLNNGTLGGSLITNTNTSIRALNDGMLYDVANCAARYYHNTVYVSGSNTTGAGTANSTYAFLRMPIDYGIPAITAGASTELRNNIFINARGGQGNHRALGNIANSNANAAINWSSTASDYNLLSGPSLTNLALWGSSTTYTLANFQSLSSSGDPNSNAVLSTTGSSDATHINPSELFVNLAALSQADLRIEPSPPSAPYPYSFVDAQGTPWRP
jgi:hypothetical protein